MTDCLSEAQTVGATACFRIGESSYTFIGVRRVENLALVDISYRSAGVGGQLFEELEAEVLSEMQAAFGKAVVEKREGKSFVPIQYNKA